MTRLLSLTAAALGVILAVTAAHAGPRGKRQPRPAPAAPHTAAGALNASPASALQFDGVGRPGPQCRPGRDTLTYHGGDLVPNPRVFVIFWGTQWQSNPAHIAAAAAVTTMFQQIGTSEYACTWSESGVAGMAFGAGTYAGSEIIASAPPSPLTDNTIQQRIVIEVNAGRAPPRTDSMVYVVVPPQSVPVEASDGSTGCGGANFFFCAYHDAFAQGGRFRYAVLPFPCTSFGGTCFVDPQEDVGRALQVAASHELAETVTDPDALPVGNSGWFSDRTGMENADICAADACIGDLTVGPQTLALNSLWSNLARGCVFSVPCSPPAPIACNENVPGVCVPSAARNRQCLLEWLVHPNLKSGTAGLPSRTVTCTDGQTFCDFDGAADGRCTFHVAGCLNSTDPRVACTAAAISSLQLTRPSPSSADPADLANAATLLGALKDVDPAATGNVAGGQIAYTPEATTADACTNILNITVPLRTVGARTLRGIRRISITGQTAAGTLRNRLTLICKPPVGP